MSSPTSSRTRSREPQEDDVLPIPKQSRQSPPEPPTQSGIGLSQIGPSAPSSPSRSAPHEQPVPATPERPQSQGRTYINTPYAEKEDAKALGACWDADRKSWYAPEGLDLALFTRWLPNKTIRLDVPFAQKDAAKALGARWDHDGRFWYLPAGIAAGQFKQWMPVQGAAARTDLFVPFSQHVQARELGAKWDSGARVWFAPPGRDLARFSQWRAPGAHWRAEQQAASSTCWLSAMLGFACECCDNDDGY